MKLAERHRQQIRAAIINGGVKGIKLGIIIGVIGCFFISV